MLELQKDARYQLRIILPSRKPYENNLHHVIKEFLASGFDFWLNMDADNPPMKNPLDLVEFNKDIMGLPTPVAHYDSKFLGESPLYLNAYDYVKESDAYRPHRQVQGLQRVDAVGTGCVLFARRVFEHPEMQKGAFVRKLYPDGTVHKGNDISFCERAKEAGFEIWTHYDYMCRHFNEIELQENMNHMAAFFKNYYQT